MASTHARLAVQQKLFVRKNSKEDFVGNTAGGITKIMNVTCI